MVQDTSIESYRQIQSRLPAMQATAYRALATAGRPVCNKELSDHLGWPINSVTPTVFKLRERGLVVESHRAKYVPTNRRVIYWRVK